MFVDVGDIYLHRDAVDFRKSINGLVLIVEREMKLSQFVDALFVFWNKGRVKDKVKSVTWPKMSGIGYCLSMILKDIKTWSLRAVQDENKKLTL